MWGSLSELLGGVHVKCVQSSIGMVRVAKDGQVRPPGSP